MRFFQGTHRIITRQGLNPEPSWGSLTLNPKTQPSSRSPVSSLGPEKLARKPEGKVEGSNKGFFLGLMWA